MGNILSHAEISAHVIIQLSKVRPDEEYLYLELGNFLTDVSQFRDPYSCFHAKRSVFVSALQSAALATVFVDQRQVEQTISNWINKLLGKALPGQRYGALTHFLIHLARFSTYLVFAEDSIFNITQPTRLLGFFTGFPVQPLPPNEVNRVFEKSFTQYYPHEHLDFPPYRDPFREGPNYRDSNLYQRQGRGLIGYLEEQLQYISEELTKIELDWVRNLRLPASHQSRRDVLVHLGHVLHAVEDFFFHSNFAEIYRWQRLRHRYPGRQSENEEDANWLLLHDLEGTSYNPRSVQLRRKMARRLRYPIFTQTKLTAEPTRVPCKPSPKLYPYEPSSTVSEDATNLVYTGGFGSNDIFHTIYGALVATEELLREEPFSRSEHSQKLINAELVLIRLLFNEQERKRMVYEKGYEATLIKQHAQQLNKGLYRTKIQELQDNGVITSAGAEELQQAFEVDKALENKSSFTPGVGGFLIKFLSATQCEAERSSRGIGDLDRDEQSILDKSTDNGASAETVGTHSLLAKDDKKEQPLREAAMALAKHASASLAVLMAKRVSQDTDPTHGLDWDSIIRYYMRFPRPSSQSWESVIIAIAEQHQELPNVDDVADRPNFRMLGPKFGADKLQERRAGKEKRTILEDRYTGLEAKEDHL